jgi:hypothetical protein
MTDFTISIKQDSVEVRLHPSSHSPYAKLGGTIFSSSMVIIVACALLFLPGKHNRPSMWHGMSTATIGSEDFLVPLAILIVGGGLLAWMSFRWSAAAWPSDETLLCDHTTLTISRIPYLDFGNSTWKTRTYSLRDIEKFRFAICASAKGNSIYGFRFRANGRRHKTLPGLEAPEARTILKTLQRFGIDVVFDDKLQKKAEEILKKRGSQVSLDT